VDSEEGRRGEKGMKDSRRKRIAKELIKEGVKIKLHQHDD
jgi:hypothetical protein